MWGQGLEWTYPLGLRFQLWCILDEWCVSGGKSAPRQSLSLAEGRREGMVWAGMGGSCRVLCCQVLGVPHDSDTERDGLNISLIGMLGGMHFSKLSRNRIPLDPILHRACRVLLMNPLVLGALSSHARCGHSESQTSDTVSCTVTSRTNYVQVRIQYARNDA